MTKEQIAILNKALATVDYVDDTDVGESCRRCLKRMLVEVLGLPLVNAPLLKEDASNLKPIYCPSQYSKD